MALNDLFERRIRQAMKRALNRLAREMVDDLRQDLSVPVEYVGGKRHSYEKAELTPYLGAEVWREESGRKVRKGSKRFHRHSGEVVRSDPGEPPRREYEVLINAFKANFEDEPSSSEMNIDTRYMVAVWLNYGTENIEPRPFWEPWMDRWAPHIRSKLKQYFNEELAKLNQRSSGGFDDYEGLDITIE